MNLFRKPYLIYWGSIPLILILGFLVRFRTMQLNIHDTYFVIDQFSLAVLISGFALIIGIAYWMLSRYGKNISQRLVKWHIGITSIAVLLLLALSFFFVNTTDKPGAAFSDYMADIRWNYKIEKVMFLVAVIMLLAQFLFPLNLILGLLNKKRIKA
ncbi:hypothetical protein [Robertkochia solimangrovi]|uniref:hypothetical protein n=1 Tax=Robertkochia solimangrovi TaxID=2213046 RepID=UPI00117E4079|nr:hypothetical protein [Robertkochia solimangrovi]